jgi:hypothetical protein
MLKLFSRFTFILITTVSFSSLGFSGETKENNSQNNSSNNTQGNISIKNLVEMGVVGGLIGGGVVGSTVYDVGKKIGEQKADKKGYELGYRTGHKEGGDQGFQRGVIEGLNIAPKVNNRAGAYIKDTTTDLSASTARSRNDTPSNRKKQEEAKAEEHVGGDL